MPGTRLTSRGRRVRAGVALGLAAGLGAGVGAALPGDRPDRVLDVAAERIAQDAVEPVEIPALRQAALEGMVGLLDDRWTTVVPPAAPADGPGAGDVPAVPAAGPGAAPASPGATAGVRTLLGTDVVLVDVDGFSAGTGRAVRDAVAAAADEQADGVVLDLRGNGGGLLTEAVETASAFLADGPVLTYQRRGEGPRSLGVAAPGDVDLPVVVLVDGGTASAAEAVAAVLADRRGAVTVGARTRGKGSVQEPVALADGSVLLLTVARYLSPDGRVVEGVGLVPDVEVAPGRGPGLAEQRAAEVLVGLVADARAAGGPQGTGR